MLHKRHKIGMASEKAQKGNGLEETVMASDNGDHVKRSLHSSFYMRQKGIHFMKTKAKAEEKCRILRGPSPSSQTSPGGCLDFRVLHKWSLQEATRREAQKKDRTRRREREEAGRGSPVGADVELTQVAVRSSSNSLTPQRRPPPPAGEESESEDGAKKARAAAGDKGEDKGEGASSRTKAAAPNTCAGPRPAWRTSWGHPRSITQMRSGRGASSGPRPW